MTAASVFTARPTAYAATGPVLHDGYGLHVSVEAQSDPRLLRLQLQTAALPRPTTVYVLLPVGYDPASARRYPVIYLLHGAQFTPDQWLTLGGAEQTIGDRPVITVIPEITLGGAGSGWCTDWANGAQKWETYDIDQLLPWVDANFQTLPNRGQRAIVGLSEGGFCATSLAARHPDLFGQAYSYSGVVDLWADQDARALSSAAVVDYYEQVDGLTPGSVFGNQVTDGPNWAAHDPATLTANLADTRLALFTGNGQPGPYDDPTAYPQENIAGEVAANQLAADFDTRLNTLGIPVRYDAYGAGTHTWPYWKRDLQWSIDGLLAGFAAPLPAPSRVTYTSGENSYRVYGWTVGFQRDGQELSTLSDAGATGFGLTGSGTATVTTPALYRPGQRYSLTVTTSEGTADVHTVTAGLAGTVTVNVPLGPSNSVAQDIAAAQASAAGAINSYTTRVHVSAPTTLPAPAGLPASAAQPPPGKRPRSARTTRVTAAQHSRRTTHADHGIAVVTPGTLASTGLGRGLPLAALGALTAAGLVRGRRKRGTHA